ncbi:acetylxylan esterase [Synoicihabitans lomoniglobus]|uniref:Acetylxylan esterase n=1 Tax=Synoicihabitans lomoniglobus TaxID=2909285 RepID=A0AAE9ZTY0_9BACT|nr:acetylxylan esterase [Opitutaceae bacterium LMO-M01]WED64216.1 acetylxylan esterase [Opitutaceae bacterium LMO-M01]
MESPSFVRLPSLHDREIDAEVARLSAPTSPPPPADFAAFWLETLAQARAIPVASKLTPSAAAMTGFEVQEIAFTSWGRVRLRGWLATPRHQPVRRGLVISHGYGGRDAPDAIPLLPDAAMIFPCTRGLGLSIDPADRDAAPHVLRGIGSRDTYIFRGCAADVWAAATALIEHVPAAADCLDYVGSSFGGGIGALALPWDDRFRRAFLGVPSFGHHPLRLQIPCAGSGEFVRRYAATHPEVVDVLRYYDAATAARFLERPTLVECALIDDVVPPVGQFAVHAALAGDRPLLVRSRSHADYPAATADDDAVRTAIRSFLTS